MDPTNSATTGGTAGSDPKAMALPWKTLEKVSTREGILELRQRGAKEFHITLGGFVLMNSIAHRSEAALGTMACAALPPNEAPRVLVSGLGLGFTLNAMLAVLPQAAHVVVAELNPVVVEWCRGPLAVLTNAALDDPRVKVEVTDVTNVIEAAASGRSPKFDAIVLDLFAGPNSDSHQRNDPFYGSLAIDRMRRALSPQGTLAVWGEAADPGYEKRLQQAGFTVSHKRPGRGGLRHVVYLARA